MHSRSLDELIDLEDYQGKINVPAIRNLPHAGKQLSIKGGKRKARPEVLQEQISLVNQQDDRQQLNFSYHASRHERAWLLNSLGNFYEGKWIEDILRLVKGGKEASVYLCQARPDSEVNQPMIAAKVYRPRMLRNLRKDHLYREGRGDLDIEGRAILNHGMQHAMRKKTTYGQELLHTSWIGHEFKTMQILYSAGIDLPKPYASDSNAILMDYIGDPEMPAPTLNTVELDPDEARALFERILVNLDRMLANHRVHADLSAYNVLYWEGQISLIDFPQAIDPQENRNSYSIFERDVRRICEYFARQGVTSRPGELARELWTAHGYRLKPEIHPLLLDDQDEEDRKYWQRNENGQ